MFQRKFFLKHKEMASQAFLGTEVDEGELLQTEHIYAIFQHMQILYNALCTNYYAVRFPQTGCPLQLLKSTVVFRKNDMPKCSSVSDAHVKVKSTG